MTRAITLLVAMVSVAVLAGCSQSPPTASPTAAQAAAPPTAAQAAAPTAAPAAVPKASYPEKGKSVNFIVPWAAGGTTDTIGRLAASALEREFGVPFQVVNKAGANSQVGLTELTRSKPDGYTMALTNLPTTAITYTDPENKAVYGRKDFAPTANLTIDAYVIAVKADGPFKDLKTFIDAAKAKPEGIKVSDSGLASATHFGTLLLQQAAGVKFAAVHFDGSAPAMTALLGGHVDAMSGSSAGMMDQVKSGQVRLLGIMDTQESPHFPGVKTMESMGYKVYIGPTIGFSMVAGTPKEIVDLVSATTKKVLADPEVKGRIDRLAYPIRYMDPQQFATHWDSQEELVKKLLPVARGG